MDVNCDKGESGASAAWHEGFQHLEVIMGRAGIVMGPEFSRCVRNNAYWRRLLEICALADIPGRAIDRRFVTLFEHRVRRCNHGGCEAEALSYLA